MEEHEKTRELAKEVQSAQMVNLKQKIQNAAGLNIGSIPGTNSQLKQIGINTTIK